MSCKFILASQSVRRKELLTQMGYHFKCFAANINEQLLLDETAEDYVSRLSSAKAEAISGQVKSNTIVLGADTCVVFQGEILGKPASLQECQYTLSLLSNATHEVLTSVSVIQNNVIKSQLVKTEVDFNVITLQEMTHYWLTGEPQDKAGSYGIQGIGGQFVKQIRGSYSAVVGLPLYETTQLLSEFGVYTTIQQPLEESR